MESNDPSSATVTGAIRGLGITLVRLLHTRLELLGVELKQEKAAFTGLCLLVGAILFFGIMAVVCATAAIVMLCPPGARPFVLLGFCAGYGGLAVGLGCRLRRRLKQRPPPLAATVEELKKDVAWMRSRT